ncbi:mitochondrial inner membrane protein OXA1L-like [Rhopilema esculentum]|uniref:mitochondrial inner membrane protein OXA1L-like n=1 Tax=Rhopilema esculentum TaxID=499914 RepID=UPI0031D12500|eukprot:gene1133-15477_t
MVGSFSRAFGGCRSNFTRFRTSQAKFSFNGSRNGSHKKFHTETGKPRVFHNVFNQQKKTVFDHVRITAFPPYNSAVCALLVAKLELGGARLNSSSVSSGGGVSTDVGSAGEASESALDPLTSSATLDEVLPTGMQQIPELLSPETLASAAQTTQDIIAAAEPSLSSLGLCAYTPVGLLQSILEVLHVNLGMPWWGSIAICTVVFRTLMLPLLLKGQVNTARLNKVKPELDVIQAEMRELANTQDTMKKSLAAMKMQKLLKDNNCHPLKGLIAPLVQLPLFLSFFIALRKMAQLPVESMSTGGLLWFTNLTAYDPYFVLPILTSATMLLTIELGTEMGISSEQMQKTKYLMRFMAFMLIPLTAKFPAAVFIYWMTSNVYSVGQILALRHPTIRKMVDLPDLEPEIAKEKTPSGSFLDNFKAGYKNAQAQALIKYQEKEKEARYKKQLKESSEVTYEYNPRLKEAEKMFKGGKNS